MHWSDHQRSLILHRIQVPKSCSPPLLHQTNARPMSRERHFGPDCRHLRRFRFQFEIPTRPTRPTQPTQSETGANGSPKGDNIQVLESVTSGGSWGNMLNLGEYSIHKQLRLFVQDMRSFQISQNINNHQESSSYLTPTLMHSRCSLLLPADGEPGPRHFASLILLPGSESSHWDTNGPASFVIL
jgi:hypothetical protein